MICPQHLVESDNALPLQAGVCDVIGIGEFAPQSSTNALITVSQYWFGNQQTNILDVRISENDTFPTEGTDFLFFLSAYPEIKNLELPRQRFMHMFAMEQVRSKFQPGGLYLLNDSRSLIPVTDDNAATISWCSNLVQTTQINKNMQAFYELIRDGYRFNVPASKMHRDSEYSFQYARHYMPTNFMWEIWSDTNLINWARFWINNSYKLKTGTSLRLPRPEAAQQ